MDADARVRCPEFPPGCTWINSRRPLRVAEDLRGRVAVLDFWTYCCINCLHTLPVLARIERRYADAPVAVIGVHSAKFISERDPANIRKAIARHRVSHPVVVDSEHDIWESFAVRAWPTLVLVDAAGSVRETLSGEVEEATLAAAIDRLLDEGRRRGILADGPLRVAPSPETETTFLRYPGRVQVAGDRLLVADTGHNRVIIADRDGRVRAVVGEGGVGSHDGSAAQASFHAPQGLAVTDDTLYVADTGNHLVRAVDLATLEVTTVAGTGEKGAGGAPGDPARPREIALRSPWGLLGIGPGLLIAMAGSHQIWLYDAARRMLGPWAGIGREDHLDGTLAEAAFAQPSGLAQAGRYVLIADSEVSSVRSVDLEAGHVQTIVGLGLFDFGDRDGMPDEARLQHPLDVAAGPDGIYVADTYNNKIKQITFGTMRTRTLLGDGRPETMHEPGGLVLDGDRLLIADTNNHRILAGDLRDGRLQELALLGD
jgi:thiol-disulfide isomerase/thioredoxin